MTSARMKESKSKSSYYSCRSLMLRLPLRWKESGAWWRTVTPVYYWLSYSGHSEEYMHVCMFKNHARWNVRQAFQVVNITTLNGHTCAKTRWLCSELDFDPDCLPIVLKSLQVMSLGLSVHRKNKFSCELIYLFTCVYAMRYFQLWLLYLLLTLYWN